jgi:hypothetical protein
MARSLEENSWKMLHQCKLEGKDVTEMQPILPQNKTVYF